MKIRIKFTKTGSLKFIGHLDVMRYFQKLNRRAGMDMVYSKGFNPHQIMSFAQPLGLGLTSLGEYVDIEVNSTVSSKEAIEAYNSESVPEIRILSYRLLPDTAANAMSSVAAADYEITFREAFKPDFDLKEAFNDFMSLPCINFVKNTKKSTRELDIKPFIYKFNCNADSLTLRLSTGSVENLKPETVLEAFYNHIGKDFNEFAFLIERTEVYGITRAANGSEKLIPLEDFGENIE